MNGSRIPSILNNWTTLHRQIFQGNHVNKLVPDTILCIQNQPSKRSKLSKMLFVSAGMLYTYVPPQNSMEVREPAVLFGSASRSSTGMPMDTTLTGSGYVSSKTARRPWMALAAASEASLAYTGYREGNTTNVGCDVF